MKKIIITLSLLIAAVFCHASEPEDLFLGTWTSGTQTLAFYGSSIGQSGTTYLQVSFTGTDQLTFNHGAGNTASYTYSFVEGDLHLNDGTTTTIYTQESTTAGTCSCNLHQVAGAKALFALDHPDHGEPAVADLLTYLGGTVPACPGGGLYHTESPTCNVHGEL